MRVENFGKFIIQERWRAIIIALICACPPFAILLNWFSVVIIGLVTLRKGAWEGFLVLLWSTLPAVVLLFLGHFHPDVFPLYWLPFVWNVLAGTLIVWVLSLILRHYVSWVLVVERATLVAVLTVFFVNIKFPSFGVWWANEVVGQTMKKIFQGLNLTHEQLDDLVQFFSQYITGFLAVVTLLAILTELALSRWWQARLYNLGGFRKEWLSLRLRYFDSIFLFVCILGIFLGFDVAKSILPVLMFPFLIAGISLTHGYLDLRNAHKGMVILFYLLLWISVMIFPWFLIILVVMAVLDSMMDFRERIALR